MKHLTTIMLLVALTSVAWAEPTNQPCNEDQHMDLRLDNLREDVVEKDELRLFDYKAPQGAEKLITHPKPEAMLTWQ